MPNFVRIGQAKNGECYCLDKDTSETYKFKPVKVEYSNLPPEIMKEVMDRLADKLGKEDEL